MKDTKDRRFNMNLGPAERDQYGCIVTFREQETGELFTRCFRGTTVEGAADACDYALRHPGRWLIASICTPVSVFRDLQGTRKEDRHHGHEDFRSSEYQALARIGRLHMLEPLRKTQVLKPAHGGGVRSGRSHLIYGRRI